MQYKIINGSVSYGADTVLENIDIEINSGERIAVVGRNGCGKTTLLNAILQTVELEAGTGEKEFRVIKSAGLQIASLNQNPFKDESVTLFDEVLSVFSELILMENKISELAKKLEDSDDESLIKQYTSLNERYVLLGGMTYKKECESIIRNFSFTDYDMKKLLCEFSGGQKTKIAFIKLLLTKPDILLLDEPTNHLDIKTLSWLEEYLQNYKSALVIVSHDRMLLDKIATKVYEIEYGEMTLYKGNYSDFERQKRENYLKAQKDAESQKAEIERITGVIERFRYKATKAKMVQSKIKLLERMQKKDMPRRFDTKTYKTNFSPSVQSSRQVLSVKDLQIGYDKNLATVCLNVEKGDRLAIIGPNGCGKSTFVKTLVGEQSALGGFFEFGYNTDVGYFDQSLAQFSGEDTLFDIFKAEFPLLLDSQVRSVLGSFMFSGDDVFKKAKNLSGGEKVRLTLCKILYKRPNVLILDEPTNHMDIIGKQTLEDILSSYEGTVIFVSHDRYFVNKLATKLLVFDGQGANYYPLTYGEYLEKGFGTQPKSEEIKQKTVKKGNYVSPLKVVQKRNRRIAKLEELIEQCEQKIAQLCELAQREDVVTDYLKLSEIEAQKAEVFKEQQGYETEWEQLFYESEQEN